MEINCPKCQEIVSSNDINISKDICFCKYCNEYFFISEILNNDEYIEAGKMLLNPPKGTWINKYNDQLIIGTFTHSKNAFFLLPFSLFFSIISFAGFFGTIKNNENIIFSLFWLIFIIPSCILIWKTIYAIFGKIEIKYSQNMIIFIGVGKVGKKINIKWDLVKKIIRSNSRDNEGHITNEIIIEENNFIRISVNDINEIKRRFLYILLKYLKNKKIEDIVRE